MSILFLLPVLLLPLLVAWLTRPAQQSIRRPRRSQSVPPEAPSATNDVRPEPSAGYRKEAQRAYLQTDALDVKTPRSDLPSYRRAAQAAYLEMQALGMEEMAQQSALATSPTRAKKEKAARVAQPSASLRNPALDRHIRHPLARIG